MKKRHPRPIIQTNHLSVSKSNASLAINLPLKYKSSKENNTYAIKPSNCLEKASILICWQKNWMSLSWLPKKWFFSLRPKRKLCCPKDLDLREKSQFSHNRSILMYLVLLFLKDSSLPFQTCRTIPTYQLKTPGSLLPRARSLVCQTRQPRGSAVFYWTS